MEAEKPSISVGSKSNSEKCELRRRQIVNGLMACMREKPFHSISIKDIAAAAGLSHGLLHYYFHSKEEILIEFVRTSMADYLENIRNVTAQLDAGKTKSPYFLDNLVLLARGFYSNEYRGYFAPYCFIWMMSFYDETLDRIVKEAYERYRQILIETIRRHSPEGTDAKKIALILIPFFEGIVASANTYQQSLEDIEAIVSDLGRVLSDSIRR